MTSRPAALVTGLCLLLACGCRTPPKPAAALPLQESEATANASHHPGIAQSLAIEHPRPEPPSPRTVVEESTSDEKPAAQSAPETKPQPDSKPVVTQTASCSSPPPPAPPAVPRGISIAVPQDPVSPAAGGVRPISLRAPSSWFLSRLGPARQVPVPPPPPAGPMTEDSPANPIRVGQMLSQTEADKDWRQWQLDRQRKAAELREAERENLLKSVENFLQPK